MKHCANHPEKTSATLCRSCGEYFCDECLDEGREFYYCRKPACHAEYREQLVIALPPNVECPACGQLFSPPENEREKRKTHCPECDCFLDFTCDPPKVINPGHYTHLLSSLNQGDISLIVGILDDAEIGYYVVGENFVSVQPLIEPARFFVRDEDVETAKELLKDFELHIFGTSAAN